MTIILIVTASFFSGIAGPHLRPTGHLNEISGLDQSSSLTDTRSGDKQTGLQKIFDEEDIQKEIAAQVAITKEFGMRASKLIGDYADGRQMDAAAL